MPYIIVLILVIAIVVVAVRKQKFDQKQANSETNKVNSIRNKEKENSIEVNDYVEVDDNSTPDDAINQ